MIDLEPSCYIHLKSMCIKYCVFLTGGLRSSPAPRKPRSAATITNGDVVLSIDDVKMAAMRNDVNVIKQALERGFPVDSPSPSGK